MAQLLRDVPKAWTGQGSEARIGKGNPGADGTGMAYPDVESTERLGTASNGLLVGCNSISEQRFQTAASRSASRSKRSQLDHQE
jgi:hypothetical protein